MSKILDFLGRLFFDKKHTKKNRKSEREREREREKKKSGVALRACWIYTIKRALGEIKSHYSFVVREEEEEKTLLKE